MRCFFTLLFWAFTCVFVLADIDHARAQDDNNRDCATLIVGGYDTKISRWPFIAALQRTLNDAAQRKHSEYYFGGEAAITKRWVLTAAHCFDQWDVTRYTSSLQMPQTQQDRLEVVIGTAKLKDVRSDQVLGIESVIIHEKYSNEIDSETVKVDNDIALIRLDHDWTGAISTLFLRGQSASEPAETAQVHVARFGRTAENAALETSLFGGASSRREIFAGSANLLEVKISIVETQLCKSVKLYQGSLIGPGQLCAGLLEGGKDSCEGESGGPLMADGRDGQSQQPGVESWGRECARAEAYGVYTQVSHHAAWFQNKTGPLTGARAWQRRKELSSLEREQALSQIEYLLGPAKGCVRIRMRGGNKQPLGAKVFFEADSDVAGRQLIIDLAADNKVTLIYPNKFVSRSDRGKIDRGGTVAIPGPDYLGFTAFQAQEPIREANLVALVVLDKFDVSGNAVSPIRLARSLDPVNDPQNFMMTLIGQIEKFIERRSDSDEQPDENLRDWGFASINYEITQ